MGATRAAQGAERAASGGVARTLVLLGWAAKGVVYLALAWLVLQLAGGGATQETSTTGALALVEERSGSSLVLVVLGLGLLLYAGGRVLEVTTLASGDIGTRDRVEAAVMAVVYVALALSAFSVAGRSGGGGGGGQQEQQGAAVLLDLPLGRLLVGVLGLGGLALGAYTAWKGVDKDFLPTLRTGEMSTAVRTWSERIGVAAYVTKGAIFALVGFFLVRAAVTYDAAEAVGLDGALRQVAEAAWGKAVLIAVSIGLLAYGLFCGLQARYRKVGASAGGTA